jgi:tetrahydromethanopterin S-methyltransferase subunit G
MTEENHVHVALLEERLEQTRIMLNEIRQDITDGQRRQIQILAGIAVSILLLLVNVIVERI